VGHDLESPGTDEEPGWDNLYLYRGDEVVAHRPIFTGDVFAGVTVPGSAEPKMVSILQHPCVIRAGIEMVPRLLVGEVMPFDILRPKLWAKQSPRVMPLVKLIPCAEEENYGVMFVEHHVVASSEFTPERRIACLRQWGVRLQMQRWIYHNTRLVVPTFELKKVIRPQFEEADIVENFCIDREDDGVDPADAVVEIDTLLSAKVGKIKRRDMLKDEDKDEDGPAEVRRHVGEFLRSLRAAPKDQS